MKRFIFEVKPEYVVCMQKSNGSYFHKLTTNVWNMDIYSKVSRKDWLTNDKTQSGFYTTGLYDQFDHKYICKFIQYKLDIVDLSKTIFYDQLD